MIQQHLEVLKENIRLEEELENKQKVIRYYRKEKKRLKRELDEAYDFIDRYVYHNTDNIHHFIPRNHKKCSEQ